MNWRELRGNNMESLCECDRACPELMMLRDTKGGVSAESQEEASAFGCSQTSLGELIRTEHIGVEWSERANASVAWNMFDSFIICTALVLGSIVSINSCANQLGSGRSRRGKQSSEEHRLPLKRRSVARRRAQSTIGGGAAIGIVALSFVCWLCCGTLCAVC